MGDETQRADSSRMVVVSNSTLLDKQTIAEHTAANIGVLATSSQSLSPLPR